MATLVRNQMVLNDAQCGWCGRPTAKCSCHPARNQQTEESKFLNFGLPDEYIDKQGERQPQVPPSTEDKFLPFGLPNEYNDSPQQENK